MVETGLGSEDAAAAYEDIGLEASVTSTAAALLASELLGAVSILAAVLGLGIAVTLVCEILDHVKIDSVIVRLDAEYLLVESYLFSGRGTVDLQYWQLHTLKPPKLRKNPWLRARNP